MLLRYLWGFETSLLSPPLMSSLLLLRYLWGIETSSIIIIHLILANVTTLPMRFWNSSVESSVESSVDSYYYVTYEVLKRGLFTWCIFTGSFVTTLPMRFWNTVVLSTPFFWGSVIILPIRFCYFTLNFYYKIRKRTIHF